MNLNSWLLVVVLVTLIVEVVMHFRTNNKLNQTIKIVREYLHVAGIQTGSTLEIAKGSRGLARSLAMSANRTLEKVETAVKDGVEKAAEVVAKQVTKENE